jgi:serine/threonine-protein kinase
MLVPEEDGVEVVKILDFGIGKLLGSDEDQEITQEGAFLGSPKYIAPEQVNERRVDQRTDVYALGVIGYECLCGRVPFEGQTNLETILAHTSKPVMPMAERSPGIVVPEIVEAFVRRCLEKEPENRPQSMEEVLRAIGECERALYGAGSLGSSTSSGGMLAQHVALRPSDSKTLALGPPPVPVFRPSVGTASPVTRMDAPPPPRSRLPVALAIALLALAVGGFAVVRLTTRDAARAGELPSTAPATSPPAAPRSFTLVLDSQPSGADVWDGDDVIGATPMQVTIDRAGVKAGPRRFIVKLDGYAPYTVLQGDSESIVKVTAPLDLLPPAPSASGAAAPSASGPPPLRGQAPRWTPPPRPNPNAAHPPPDTDIKLQR